MLGGSNSTKKEGDKWREDKIDKFDKEFPSLRGGKFENAVPATTVTNGSVWDTTNKGGKIHLSTSVNKKIYLVQKPIRNDIAKTGSSTVVSTGSASSAASPKSIPRATVLKQTTKNASNSISSTSVYHTLMPAKGSMGRRPSKDSDKSNGQPSKPNARPHSPPSHLDVLNSRVVTQPKRISNKSDFLKELRDDGTGPYGGSSGYVVRDRMAEDGKDVEALIQNNVTNRNCNEADGSHFDYFDYDDTKYDNRDLLPNEIQNGCVEHVENTEDCLHLTQSVNGLAIEKNVKVDQVECKVLSRSLEAEQRLLREMGWKEEGSDDEAVYAPLTEDEMKEFKNLSKQIPKRNGFRRSHQFTWSPKRIPNALDLENESSGSSSTDSDSD